MLKQIKVIILIIMISFFGNKVTANTQTVIVVVRNFANLYHFIQTERHETKIPKNRILPGSAKNQSTLDK